MEHAPHQSDEIPPHRRADPAPVEAITTYTEISPAPDEAPAGKGRSPAAASQPPSNQE